MDRRRSEKCERPPHPWWFCARARARAALCFSARPRVRRRPRADGRSALPFLRKPFTPASREAARGPTGVVRLLQSKPRTACATTPARAVVRSGNGTVGFIVGTAEKRRHIQRSPESFCAGSRFPHPSRLKTSADGALERRKPLGALGTRLEPEPLRQKLMARWG